MSALRKLLALLQDRLRRRASWRYRALAAESALRLARAELDLARGVSAALGDQMVALGTRAETARRSLSGERS